MYVTSVPSQLSLKAYAGREGKAPHILDLDTGLRV
jgi:hypothetical protein